MRTPMRKGTTRPGNQIKTDRLDGGNGRRGASDFRNDTDRRARRFNGGKGKDKLRAKDGEKDTKLDCGPGSDPNPKADGKDPNPISC